MSDDDPIAPELPIAFVDGHPVTVSEPAVYDEPEEEQPDRLTLADVFDALLYAAANDGEVSARVAMLGYLLKAERAPRSLEELGAHMGVSKQAAAQRLTRFRGKIRVILAPRLTDPPIVE